jgi:hypothetical protein
MATSYRALAEAGMVPPLAKIVADNLSGSNPNVAAITAISTADATDLATAITLANATKAKVNALIAALKA